MNYLIRHITDYSYEDAASLSYNEARLLPRPLTTFLYDQQVSDAKVQIDPGWNDYRERVDFYGNRVIFYTVRQPHHNVVITAQSQVQVKGRRRAQPDELVVEENAAQETVSADNMTADNMTANNMTANNMTANNATAGNTAQGTPIAEWLRENAEQSAAWDTVTQRMKSEFCPTTLEARQFCLPSPLIPMLEEVAPLADEHFSPGRPVVAAALSLMEFIFTEFDFVADATDVATPISKVIRKRQGVCQDFAQVMIAVLRSRGLASRYMSGYIETLPPPGQEKLEGSDASHAWCSLYVPDLGWIDLDPTNNLVPVDQHVILGWGRDFGDVSPIKGVYYGGTNQELDVSVDMKRVPKT